MSRVDPSTKADIAFQPALEAGHISGLDGIRAISIAIVMISHYAPAVFPGDTVLIRIFPGMFGVSMFFVLSGLLICTLLLREFKSTGTIDLRNFYLRRLVRLSPALMVYLAILMAAYWITDGTVNGWIFLSAATYTSNYYGTIIGGSFYFMPVWSLAIEEHFYLLFPIALLYLLRRFGPVTAIRAFATVLVVILAWRLYLTISGTATERTIYHHTDTRFDAPLFGVVLALIMARFGQSAVATFIRSWCAMALGIALIAVSVVIRDELFRMTVRYSLQGMAIALVFGYVVFRMSGSAFGRGAYLSTAHYDS